MDKEQLMKNQESMSPSDLLPMIITDGREGGAAARCRYIDRVG